MIYCYLLHCFFIFPLAKCQEIFYVCASQGPGVARGDNFLWIMDPGAALSLWPIIGTHLIDGTFMERLGSRSPKIFN
jgi:hypothetical protein